MRQCGPSLLMYSSAPCEQGAPQQQAGSKAGLLCCIDLVKALHVGDSFDPVEAQASFTVTRPQFPHLTSVLRAKTL